MAYQCPLCQQALSLTERTYRCANNHQFDLAKEGYVNLMPAHHKRSKDPGDNKEMMQARREFLAQNHYDPMRQAIAKLCQTTLVDTSHRLLDIGCGEGYYTHQLAQSLQQSAPNAQVFGLDISKVAIRYASKRYPDCDFSVASSHRLPFADHSLNGIVRIYAPCKSEELYRTLDDHGVVITVTPAQRHLYQLREAIYDEVRLHDETPEQLTGFILEHEEKMHYMMQLSGQCALNLLQMTPFAWKATPELKQSLAEQSIYQCEADFMLRVYRKQ